MSKRVHSKTKTKDQFAWLGFLELLQISHSIIQPLFQYSSIYAPQTELFIRGHFRIFLFGLPCTVERCEVGFEGVTLERLVVLPARLMQKKGHVLKFLFRGGR